MEQQIKTNEVSKDTAIKQSGKTYFVWASATLAAVTTLLLGGATLTSGGTSSGDVETFAKTVFEARLPESYKSQSKHLAQVLMRESNRHGFHPLMVLALIETESGFNANAVGSVGEIGLMQVRPSTAKILLKSNISVAKQILKNPVRNLEIGIAYLAQQKQLKQTMNASAKTHFILASYNMGPAKFSAAFRSGVRKTKYSRKIVNRSLEFHRQLLGMVPVAKPIVRASIRFAQL